MEAWQPEFAPEPMLEGENLEKSSSGFSAYTLVSFLLTCPFACTYNNLKKCKTLQLLGPHPVTPALVTWHFLLTSTGPALTCTNTHSHTYIHTLKIKYLLKNLNVCSSWSWHWHAEVAVTGLCQQHSLSGGLCSLSHLVLLILPHSWCTTCTFQKMSQEWRENVKLKYW